MTSWLSISHTQHSKSFQNGPWIPFTWFLSRVEQGSVLLRFEPRGPRHEPKRNLCLLKYIELSSTFSQFWRRFYFWQCLDPLVLTPMMTLLRRSNRDKISNSANFTWIWYETTSLIFGLFTVWNPVLELKRQTNCMAGGIFYPSGTELSFILSLV